MMDPNFMNDAMEMMKDPAIMKQVCMCVCVCVVAAVVAVDGCRGFVY